MHMSTDFVDCKNALLCFCKNHKRVYIYGCGEYGILIFDYLEQRDISVDAFLETYPKRRIKRGTAVLSPTSEEITYSPDTGIIMGMRNELREEALDSLNKIAIVDTFSLSDAQFEQIKKEMNPQLSANVKMADYLLKYPVDRHLNVEKWNRILIVQLDLLGDLVWTTPLIRELRRNCPQATIEIVISIVNRDVLEGCPYLDCIHVLDLSTIHKYADFHDFEDVCNDVMNYYIEEFGECRFDACFLPRFFSVKEKIENILLALYCGASQRIGWGFASNLNGDSIQITRDFFTRYIVGFKTRHYVEYRLDMLRICGLEVISSQQELWPSGFDEYKNRFFKEYVIDANDLIIILGINGSIPIKNWSMEKYEEVIWGLNNVFDSEICFIIVGDEKASERAAKVGSIPNCINMVGKTSINELINLVKLSDGYIGADTGVAHIAATFGKPMVVLSPHISGYSDFCPELVAPRGERVSFIHPFKGLGDCTSVCKSNVAHCINQIDSQTVISELVFLLGGEKSE